MKSRIARREYVKRIAIWTLVLSLIVPAGPACAQRIEFQTQLRYDFLQSKRRGESAKGDGRFATSYNLAMRRPLTPRANLMSDITFNSSETEEIIGRQSARNWTVNLFAREPRYTFVGRMSRNDFDSISSSQQGASSGFTTDYHAGLFLRQPAYPVINLQYSRNVTGSSYAGSTSSYVTNTWLMSGYYDMAPLRFTHDRTRQTYSYPGSSGVGSLTQRSAVLMNYSLMQGLTLATELSRYTIDTEHASGRSGTSTNRRLIRLSATPTPAIAANLDFSEQANEQDTGFGSRMSKNKTMSLGARTVIIPGLSLDYSDQQQSQNVSGLLTQRGESRNRSLALNARLGEGTVLSTSLSRFKYNLGTELGDAHQDSLQTALQTRLSSRTDLGLSYGRNQSRAALGDSYRSAFAGVSLRDRTSDDLSLGANYHWSKVRSAPSTGEPLRQKTEQVDVDALWLPTRSVGINLRLSYQANNGASVSELVAPAFNFRWQIDSRSNLTLNYSRESLDQWDPVQSAIIGQRTRGLSMRFTHGFPDGSSLDVFYNFSGTNTGDSEWQRQLRAYFTTRL